MSDQKVVKDLMMGIFEYPHIPYWFSIREAVGMVRASFLERNKYPEPLVILVFDETYSLLGTLTLKDILRGLQPGFLKRGTKAQVPDQDESDLTLLGDTFVNKESLHLAETPVQEIMVPAKAFVGPDDSVTRAAYVMLRHDLILLPVLEEKKKFVGLVRMVEVFDEVTRQIVEE